MKRVLVITGLILITGLAVAQKQTVTGRITDHERNPIPYATVTETGTQNNAIADAEGYFSIVVQTNAKLSFSAIGYTSETLAVSGNLLSVSLTQAEADLEEVIVTAQGIKRRTRELGYSATKVSTGRLLVGRSPQIAQALSGKVAGLNIFNVDNSIDPQVKVVLRGYRSMTGSNEALLVIDGIPYATQTSLALINPNDLESIIILKGGQAATLYGSAGVNGALIMRTKTGTKGKAKVSYNSATNIEQISFLPWMQNQYGSGAHYAAAFGTPGYKANYIDRMHDNWRPFENWSYGDAYDGSVRIVGRVLEDGSQFMLPYSAIKGEHRKRWNTGFTTNNQLAISGGDGASTYYVSAENTTSQGIVPGDKSRRTGVRATVTTQLQQLSLRFNTAYTQANYDRTTANYYADVMTTPAHIPLSQLKDWRTNKFANPNSYFSDFSPNPYFDADNNRQKYRDANFTGNLEVAYQLLPWLNLNNRAGMINNTRTTKFSQPQFFYTDWAKNKAYVPAPWEWANDYNGISRAASDIFGNVADVITTDNTFNNEFQIHASLDIGQFSNKLIFGASVIELKRKQVSVSSGSLVQDSVFNVSNRQGELLGGEFNTTFRKYGYYADLITGWKEFAFVHVAYRNDGSSAFFTPERPSNLYRFSYYGADASFIATEAIPSIRNRVITYAKLRVAYNRNANDNIDPFNPYQLDLTYNNGNGFPFGNRPGLTVGDILPDPHLKPEIVHSFEAGGEFQFLDNAISLDITAYRQESTGQILTVKAPASSGFPFVRLNVGETKNWGYEADLSVQIIKGSKRNWVLNGYYSYNNNEVIKLYKGINEFSYQSFVNAQTNVVMGQSFPVLKATAYERDPVTGRVVVNPENGYPLLSPKLTNFGRTTPPHGAGLGTNLRIGNFSLAANAEYRGGNVVYHSIGVAMTRFGTGGWTGNRMPHVFPNSAYADANGKYVPNKDVKVQEAEYTLWGDYYQKIAENFITPGWFIKLRDVNVTYDLPSNWISKTHIVSKAVIGLFGRNLITVVDKMNHFTDPEFSISTGNGIGINNTFNTPPVRQYGFHINVTF